MGRLAISIVIAGVLGGVGATLPDAHADERGGTVAPWAVGLTPEREAAAQAALAEGNRRFLDKNYVGALESYRTAIAHWDHPAIRFNIVRCLIQLDKPVEAQENLAAALQYGAAPLDPTVYSEALNYQKLLARQVGDIVVACKQAGVTVTLDGKSLGTCPLEARRQVLPGSHQLVAAKPGFVTRTYDVNVVGADEKSTTIELVPVQRTSRTVHRWRAWVPWTVFASGLGVAGLGGLVQLKAASDMDRFDEQGAKCARVGCTEDQLDRGLESSAKLENKIAIGIMSVGAAAAITGGVMLYLNRGETRYDEPANIAVVPMPGGGFVSLSGSL